MAGRPKSAQLVAIKPKESDGTAGLCGHQLIRLGWGHTMIPVVADQAHTDRQQRRAVIIPVDWDVSL